QRHALAVARDEDRGERLTSREVGDSHLEARASCWLSERGVAPGRAQQRNRPDRNDEQNSSHGTRRWTSFHVDLHREWWRERLARVLFVTRAVVMDCHRHVKSRRVTPVSSRRLARWNKSAASRVLLWSSKVRSASGAPGTVATNGRSRRDIREADLFMSDGRTSLIGSGAWPTTSTGSQ